MLFCVKIRYGIYVEQGSDMTRTLAYYTESEKGDLYYLLSYNRLG